MALVFQYGSNTSSARLNSSKRLRGDATDLGLVVTEGMFELHFDVWSQTNKCAAADIREGGGRVIWGVLYRIPDYLIQQTTAGARKSLDSIEGPLYRRVPIAIRSPKSTPIDGAVVTYTVRDPQPGLSTSLEYAQHILAGLQEHGAPADYLAYVKIRVIASNPDLVGRL